MIFSFPFTYRHERQSLTVFFTLYNVDMMNRETNVFIDRDKRRTLEKIMEKNSAPASRVSRGAGAVFSWYPQLRIIHSNNKKHYLFHGFVTCDVSEKGSSF